MIKFLLENTNKTILEKLILPAGHSGVYDPLVTFKAYPQGSAEPKLDGIRGLAYKDSDTNEYVIMSRGSKTLNNTSHILHALKPLIDQGYAVDGELFGGDWNSSMSFTGTKSVHPSAVANLKFYVFDMITPEEIQSEVAVKGYKDRRLRMLKLLRQYRIKDPVIPIERIKIKHHDDIYKVFRSVLDKGLSGVEGIMYKSHQGIYRTGGKSVPWFKMKMKYTNDYKIVGATEGTGKYVGMLGNIIVDVNGEKTSVGTGFNDITRKELWNMYLNNDLLGKIAEINFQEKTKSGVLRFSSFSRLRTDKSVPSEDVKLR